MKLLPKKQVHIEVAMERKRQIDQGIKLAEKVDTLRETKQREERELDEFRKSSVKAVQIEIDTLLKDKENLQREIEIATVDLQEKRKPLDSEWAELKKSKDVFEEKSQLLSQEQIDIKEFKSSLLKREKDLREEEIRIAEERRQATQALLGAQEYEKRALDALGFSRKEAERLARDSAIREKDLQRREEEVLLKEEGVMNKWKEVDRAEQDIIKRERILADRVQTFEREQNRYGKRTNRSK